MRVAVLLAAGASRRFGAPNKLFARVGGRSLLAQAVLIAGKAPAQRLIVVTGAQSSRVAREARRADRSILIVRAPDHREGLGASLRAASRRLRPIDRAAFVFLADMPWVPPELAGRLLRQANPGDTVIRPVCRGRPGHPVLLRKNMLAGMGGDEGPGRGSGLRARLVASDRRCLADIDRPGALFRRVPRLR